ncbi:DUF397 domain-containing protein [Streptomyces sp. NPDC048441]|uniref:DUF397 domain-containing protein n=1 Tax=Streptomyces sp. NPDC048441 TaxID=3365552 RepID=UPI0037167BE8
MRSTLTRHDAAARLEVAQTWAKSSHSSGEGGECVEVSPCHHAIHVRDSKNPEGPNFGVEPSACAAFITHAAR